MLIDYLITIYYIYILYIYMSKLLPIYISICYIMIQYNFWIKYQLYQKRFYNRETNSAAFCVILQLSIKPLPFYATQIVNPFLNSIISSNHEKRKDFHPMHCNGEILIHIIVSQFWNIFCFDSLKIECRDCRLRREGTIDWNGQRCWIYPLIIICFTATPLFKIGECQAKDS